MVDDHARRGSITAVAPPPAVGDIDVLTGQPLDEMEVEYRLKIQQEFEYIAVDADYAALRAAIHQPLGDGEFGQLNSDGWALERPAAALQLPLLPDDRDQSSQESVVQLIRHFVGDFPARMMHLLFEVANDPPFYRRPDITVSINDLLDRLGYTRDSRGIHYSANRKRVTSTLQALYLTHVELYQRRGRTTNGFTAPLLSFLGFSTTSEDARNMPIREVFARGLPDVVRLTINSIWYKGVRNSDNRPGTHYQLLPRATVETTGRRRGAHRGRAAARSGRSVDNLRVYVQRCQVSTQARQVDIALASLLQEAGITNRNTSQAAITLRRALDKLVDENVISAHRQVQRGATAVVELRW
jgi:hypothetical protein